MPLNGLYKIVNKSNGKFYVGRSINIEKRFARHLKELNGNKHHCIFLQRAWNKYGSNKFEFVVVKHSISVEEATNLEAYYLENYRQLLYNTSHSASGGDLISYHENRDEIVAKMKHSLLKRYENLSQEEKNRIYGRKGEKNGMFGKTHTTETMKLIKQKQKIYLASHSSYRKDKTFEELFGNREAIRLRKILSNSAKKRTGDKNGFYGKKHHEETKLKIAEKKKGKIPANARPVIIDGVEFPSATEASRRLNVVPATILNRIKSKNPLYQNYFYKERME